MQFKYLTVLAAAVSSVSAIGDVSFFFEYDLRFGGGIILTYSLACFQYWC